MGFSYDFIIQNNGSVNIAFLDDRGQALTDGILIIPGQSISKDDWTKSIILIAGSTNNNVNMAYQVKTRIQDQQQKEVKIPSPMLVKIVGEKAK